VGDEWGVYFDNLLDANGAVGLQAPATNGAATQPVPVTTPKSDVSISTSSPAPRSAGQPAGVATELPPVEKMQIRGPALKIVENMEESLTVPTATSVRQIQIKLLDENRRWINRHLESQGKVKTSYTHFIAWAMIKALGKHPQMNDGYEEVDGTAYRLKRPDVNLGVAVDVQKKDGTRTLLVPNIKGANRMTFAQ